MHYKITALKGPLDINERLKELGLVVGQMIQVLHPLPFQGPRVILTAQGLLSLRFDEYECLNLELIK